MELEQVFESARGLNFEDGVDNEFTINLRAYVKANGNPGVDAIKDTLDSGEIALQVIAETLLWLGDIDADEDAVPNTKESRRELIESYIDHESVFVRDAVPSALSYLTSVESLPLLCDRLKIEPVDHIRRNLRGVIRYFRNIMAKRSIKSAQVYY